MSIMQPISPSRLRRSVSCCTQMWMFFFFEFAITESSKYTVYEKKHHSYTFLIPIDIRVTRQRCMFYFFDKYKKGLSTVIYSSTVWHILLVTKSTAYKPHTRIKHCTRSHSLKPWRVIVTIRIIAEMHLETVLPYSSWMFTKRNKTITLHWN